MSITRQLIRRAPLAAAFGLTAALGFLPATASAFAIFANSAVVEVDGSPIDSWDVLNSGFGSVDTETATGTTSSDWDDAGPLSNTGAFSISAESEGSAGNAVHSLAGDLTFNLLTEISITVTRLQVAPGDSFDITFSGTNLSSIDLPSELATSSVTIALYQVDNMGVRTQLDSQTSSQDTFFGSLVTSAIDDAMGGIDLILSISLDGTACSPDCTTVPPVPEPATLSLLGLGLLATGYARRRRRA